MGCYKGISFFVNHAFEMDINPTSQDPQRIFYGSLRIREFTYLAC